ncbi:MAG: hypothetical protein DRI26_00100 [Chloroflexi bacterium]|nr:MAG: hypothetical protein DRI26_00100 [Chloroflexota bacterium]
MKGDLGSRGERTLDGQIIPPVSCIVGNDIQIHEVIQTLLKFYFPRAKVIYDPTCGDENYQFAPWIGSDNHYQYIASDIRRTRWTHFLADIMHLPLRDESVDVIVYDPPFVPYARTDRRGEEYDIAETKSPLKIFSFYSERAMFEIWRVVRQGAIIRGMDFYYPPHTNNLYLLLPRIWPSLTKYFHVVACHIYRIFSQQTLLLRYRWARPLGRVRRPLIVHSYLIVCYKRRIRINKARI